MNHLPLIIKREYLTKVKNKSFIIMTILSPIIMVALIAVVAYLTQLNKNTEKTIAILDESGMIASVFEDTETTKYLILDQLSLESAKKLTETQENYGLLYIGNFEEISDAHKNIKFYSEESPSINVISDLESKLEKQLTDLKLESQGVDIEKIRTSKVTVAIGQESYLGKKTSKIDSLVKLIFGGAAGYLLFMFIIIYGNMIMRSVIEEKTSRIIEIIISSVKPIQLMLGKIIGTSLAGITQFVIWVILGGILVTIISAIFGVDLLQASPSGQLLNEASNGSTNPDIVQSAMRAFYNLPLTNLVIAFLLFFIAGYLLYSSLYAAIGAAVDNETDTQQFLMPILMPLILAVYIGFFTVIENPHGTISTIFSFIPFTSPVVMLMRIPFGVPIWQQIVSLVLLIGTFMFTVWFAAKIYRVGILMYGKKPTYREILKWIKY
ncbi:ABC transporter permease [Bizionia argentinensis JUB59]|uniref:ABC transporter permease n=1 Tax=Bizionia argentinensis JUB59 TaxID=1046627 RepID=G2EF30_9FLAO|nr:ABC transporter permease [Bizionia argentinensis]EGV42971.2 ABC transporter permease [Bizionia argentinensis JUB59]